MIELTKFPEEILRAEDGDKFLVDGKEYILADIGGYQCYLESTDIPWTHVRDSNGVALLKKSELFRALRTNTFKAY